MNVVGWCTYNARASGAGRGLALGGRSVGVFVWLCVFVVAIFKAARITCGEHYAHAERVYARSVASACIFCGAQHKNTRTLQRRNVMGTRTERGQPRNELISKCKCCRQQQRQRLLLRPSSCCLLTHADCFVQPHISRSNISAQTLLGFYVKCVVLQSGYLFIALCVWLECKWSAI